MLGGDAAAPAPPGIKNAQRPRTDLLTLLFSALSDFPPPAGNCILIHCPQDDAEGTSFTPRHPSRYSELARSHPHFMSQSHLRISEHRFIYSFLSKPTAAPAQRGVGSSDQQPDQEPLILSRCVFYWAALEQRQGAQRLLSEGAISRLDLHSLSPSSARGGVGAGEVSGQKCPRALCSTGTPRAGPAGDISGTRTSARTGEGSAVPSLVPATAAL